MGDHVRAAVLWVAAVAMLPFLACTPPTEAPQPRVDEYPTKVSSEYFQRAGTPIGGRSLFTHESASERHSVMSDSLTTPTSVGDSLDERRARWRAGLATADLAEAVVAYRQFRDAGAAFDRIEFERLLNAVSRVAWGWGPNTGQRRVALWGPLDGTVNDTLFEHQIRAEHAIGLMESGDREAAVQLWRQSEDEIVRRWSLLRDRADEASLEHKRRLEQSLGRFGLALVASPLPDDKKEAVRAARAQWERARDTSARQVATNRNLLAPHVRAQAEAILSDAAMVNLTYCLYEAALGTDRDLNPFLADEPDTALRFVKRVDTGLPASSRIALGDFDGDGFCDVLLPGAGLWRNSEGSGRFERVDEALGLTCRGQAGALVDLDNDGKLDVLVVGPGRVSTALQQLDGTFHLIEIASPITAENPEGLGFFDGDRDGYLDVYIASYENVSLGAGTSDVVLRNRGDGTFEDCTDAWGFDREELDWCGRGVSPGDYNRDGHTDIYVSNYRLNPNVLWTQRGDPQRFAQAALRPPFDTVAGEILQRPVYERGTHGDSGIEGYRISLDRNGDSFSTWGHTIGSAWGDIDNNGWPDLVTCNLAHPRFIAEGWSDITRVYLNNGSAFIDHTLDAGVNFRETHSDPVLADFDNDGFLDLNITNIYPYFTSQFFLNDGARRFREATWTCGAVATNAWGQAVADFDNDGDLDLFICDGNEGVQLFENKLIDAGRPIPRTANFVRLRLVPPTSDAPAADGNPMGRGRLAMNGSCIGARVTVIAGQQTFVREIDGGRGTSSFDDTLVHVGLGAYDGPVEVIIHWPNGRD